MALIEWRPVVGFGSDRYEVSATGLVRSHAHSGMRAWTFGRKANPTLLKQKTKGDGYREVCLKVAGVQRMAYVHRLMLEAFVGPAPAGTQVAHLNGDPSDNRLNNLQWVPQKVNAAQRRVGERKLADPAKVQAVAMLFAAGMSMPAIAHALKLNLRTVKRLIPAGSTGRQYFDEREKPA